MTTLELMVDELLDAHRFHDATTLLDDAVYLTIDDARAIALDPKRINYIGVEFREP